MSERPQGPQEALFTEIFLQSSGAVQLTVLAQLTDPADAAELLAVLPAIHSRHPMLHGRAEQREATEWWWVFDVAFEDIDIRRVTIDDDFDASDFYETEASLTLDILSVNYRVTLLTRDSGVNWIALTVNHAAIDGRSSLNVLSEIDGALAGKSESDTSLPIPLSAEDGLAAAGYSGHSDLLPPSVRRSNVAGGKVRGQWRKKGRHSSAMSISPGRCRATSTDAPSRAASGSCLCRSNRARFSNLSRSNRVDPDVGHHRRSGRLLATSPHRDNRRIRRFHHPADQARPPA